MNIQDLPEYQSGQYYNLGSDKTQAQAGLDQLNSFMPVLNMQLWASELEEHLDGNYRIPRIPTCRLIDAMTEHNIDQSAVVGLMETYVISIDDYDQAWYPVLEEL